MSGLPMRKRRVTSDDLIEAYDRLLELYCLTDDAEQRGDRKERRRLQVEIDRLQRVVAELRQVTVK